jgi:hypothetical protein
MQGEREERGTAGRLPVVELTMQTSSRTGAHGSALDEVVCGKSRRRRCWATSNPGRLQSKQDYLNAELTGSHAVQQRADRVGTMDHRCD